MNTKFLIVAALVASFAILASTYATAPAHAAPRDVVEDFVAAINDGDADAAADLFAEDAVFTDIDGGSFAAVGRPAIDSIFPDAIAANLQISLTNVATNGDNVTGIASISDDESDAAGVDRYRQPFTAVVQNDLIVQFHLTYDTNDQQTNTYLDYLESQEGDDFELPPGTATITLGPGRDGSQTGEAFIFEEGGLAFVGIEIAAGTPGVLQPAHVHDGDCPGVGAIAFPLASVLDGFSFTILSASQAELLGGDFAINVHQSAQQASIYTACGEVGATGAAPTATAPAPGATAPAATPTRGTGVTAPDTGTGPADSGSPLWLGIALVTGAIAVASGGLLAAKRR